MKSTGMMKMTMVWGICLSALGIFGCRENAKKGESGEVVQPTSAVVKVVVKQVNESEFDDWGSYSADLRGVEDAYLTAPYQGGRVNTIKPVGTRVSAGESLCDIDRDRYEAAYKAAQAQVEVARGDLERATANVEKGSLGHSAVDAANLGYQNARMVLATAQRAFEDCQCQAPFDGVLVSRAIERYQTVAPGTPTVRISRVDRLEAVIAIPETEAFSYAEGMKTEFTLLQDPGRVYTGKLKSLDRAIDQRSRTVSARIELANSDRSLKPGMVGRARILRKSYGKAIVIPSSAVLRLQNGISVMKVVDSVARQQAVTIGTSSDSGTLVTSGLNDGDLLIVSGGFQVSDGTQVSYEENN